MYKKIKKLYIWYRLCFINYVNESRKINCWEFNGSNQTCNDCPVTAEERLDGVHGGTNAGRACWVVVGTRCNGESSGTFAQKYDQCHECAFYKTVAKEEGSQFIFSAVLTNLLNKE
jgi:hypothetical protein